MIILSLITGIMLGLCYTTSLFLEFRALKRGDSINPVGSSIKGMLRIIGLSSIFYFLLHHLTLNFILVIISCAATMIGMIFYMKARLYGKL